MKRPELDLADSLRRESDADSYLRGRSRRLVTEAEAQTQDISLPWFERLEESGDLLPQGSVNCLVLWARSVEIDHFGKLDLTIVTDGRGKRHGVNGRPECLAELFLCHGHHGSQLGQSRRPAQLHLQVGLLPPSSERAVADLAGQADGSIRVGDAARDALAD